MRLGESSFLNILICTVVMDQLYSSAVNSTDLMQGCFLDLFMNRITNAVTRSNFIFVLYLGRSIISSIFNEPCSDIPDQKYAIGVGFFIMRLIIAGAGEYGVVLVAYFPSEILDALSLSLCEITSRASTRWQIRQI